MSGIDMRSSGLALAFGWALLVLFEAPASARTLDYEVSSEGHRLGRLEIELRETESDGVVYTETVARTKLRVKALFLTVFSLDSHERLVVGPSGMELYESDTKVDGSRIRVTGHREGDRLDFEVEMDDVVQGISFSQEDFDFNSFDGPDLAALSTDQPEVLRVLDLDRLEVVERRFAWANDDTLEVAGERVVCRVLEVSDDRSRSRRWISATDLGLVIAEEGVDEDGPFRIVLKNAVRLEEVR